MITVSAHNFRGCRSAEIECAPIALVCGLNAAGKSSLAMGVGCALSGNMQPIGRASLVGIGAASATVELQGEGGRARGEWPAGRVVTEGDQIPEASTVAAGLESIVTMAARDRAKALSTLLHAEPTIEDVRAAFEAKGGFDVEQITSGVWSLIEQHGWDGTHQHRRDRGAEMKGQWRQITGANYGSRVAATWRLDLEDEDEDTALARLANARSRHERTIASGAVSADEKRRLEEEAQLGDARQEALVRITERVEEFTGVHRKVQEARQALPPAGQPTTIPCPYCASPIVVNRVGPETRFEKIDSAPLSDEAVRKRRVAIAEADGKVAHAYDDLNQARRDLSKAESAVRASLDAQERIANWPRAIEMGTDVAAAEAEVRRAETALADCRRKKEADELHARITRNEVIIDLLAGDGLRAQKLLRVVALFQAQLDSLTDAAKWPRVEIDTNDMGLMLDRRVYPLLSTSEQYRCRVAVQIATAMIDGSSMVVIDGADILDAPSRSGLFAMLDLAGLPALVCMTYPRREIVPDLAALGMGRSYWLTMGVVEPIEQRVAA
jgi:hypothetical protein